MATTSHALRNLILFHLNQWVHVSLLLLLGASGGLSPPPPTYPLPEGFAFWTVENTHPQNHRIKAAAVGTPLATIRTYPAINLPKFYLSKKIAVTLSLTLVQNGPMGLSPQLTVFLGYRPLYRNDAPWLDWIFILQVLLVVPNNPADSTTGCQRETTTITLSSREYRNQVPSGSSWSHLYTTRLVNKRQFGLDTVFGGSCYYNKTPWRRS